ncbi:MAG TPA: cupin domain-containing protein [Bacillales bacterium]|nr:cupin domain-containing protein [Bacillales bacterium]
MQKANEWKSEYRYGDHGPKYLTKGPKIDMGVVVLKPGQDHQNHYHKITEETFFVLEGETDFYINEEHVPMKKGDMLQVHPTESHYLINQSDQDFKAIFVKAPHLEERDTFPLKKPNIKRSEKN